MFAPAPPRCCTRSSTRKERETFSIFPSTNWSVNLPGKVIRWSVAIEPVTRTDMRSSPGNGGRHGRLTPAGDRHRGWHSLGVPVILRSGRAAEVDRPVQRVVTQRPAQLHAELRRPDPPEQAADRGAGGDPLHGQAEPGDPPGPAEGEAGHRDPGRALP